GERTAEALTVCALTHECIGLPVDKHPPFTLVHHPSLPKEEEPQSPAILTRLQLCNKDLTLLAFTGILWCHHCKVAQPNILKLKAANPSHVFQIDTEDKEDICAQFHIEEYPTFLVFDPKTKTYSRI